MVNREWTYDTQGEAEKAAWDLAQVWAGQVFVYWIQNAKRWGIAPADTDVPPHWRWVATMKPAFCVA